MPVESGIVHRTAEEVGAVGGLAGGFEQRHTQPILELGCERFLPEGRKLLEDRILLDRRGSVEQVLEARRHRLRLDDLEPHRVDRHVEPELGCERRGPRAGRQDDLPGGDRTDVGQHATDPAIRSLEGSR